MYDRSWLQSVIGLIVAFEVKEFLRVVKQCDIIVVHCSCILVSERQILGVQLCSLST